MALKKNVSKEVENEKVDFNVEVLRAKYFEKKGKSPWVSFDLKVNGVKIYNMTLREYTNKEGEEGIMIGFPSRQGSDGKYYTHAWFPISRELTDEIVKQVNELI